jgi:phenylacetate-CoA ligase
MLSIASQRSNWPHEQFVNYRNQRLLAFVHHALTTVPYYQKLAKELGFTIDDIRTVDDFSSIIPILTKQTVQENYELFLSNIVPPSSQIINHTSGTTGGGLRFATTRQAFREQWAIWWRCWQWHGIDRRQWCGYFAGRSVVPLEQTVPPYWRYNYAGRQILFSGYHMGPETIGDYVSELKRAKPPWLRGYPSLLAMLAAYLIDNKIDLGYPIKVVTTAAENLLPQQAQLMKEAFGVEPRQHYGMAEAVANASECEYGNLHVDEDFAFMEFVFDKERNSFQIIGTNFSNAALPMLRYQVGDTGQLSSNPCPCGKPGRIIDTVDGRLEDYVILKNGARIGRLDHILKDLVHIREAQIYQNEIGKITFRVVPLKAYRSSVDESKLISETRKRLGQDTEIQIEYVDQLRRTSTGKLRFVVSELESGKVIKKSTFSTT